MNPTVTAEVEDSKLLFLARDSIYT